MALVLILHCFTSLPTLEATVRLPTITYCLGTSVGASSSHCKCPLLKPSHCAAQTLLYMTTLAHT